MDNKRTDFTLDELYYYLDKFYHSIDDLFDDLSQFHLEEYEIKIVAQFIRGYFTKKLRDFKKGNKNG